MLEILENYITIKHDTKAYQYHGNLDKDERDKTNYAGIFRQNSNQLFKRNNRYKQRPR